MQLRYMAYVTMLAVMALLSQSTSVGADGADNGTTLVDDSGVFNFSTWVTDDPAYTLEDALADLDGMDWSFTISDTSDVTVNAAQNDEPFLFPAPVYNYHKADSWVVGGQMTGFTDQVTITQKSDGNLAFMLAALQASKHFNKTTQAAAWVQNYTKYLKPLAFVVSDLSYTEEHFDGEQFSLAPGIFDFIYDLFWDYVTDGFTSAVADGVKNGCYGLQDETSGQFRVFAQQSFDQNKNNFLVDACTVNSAGELTCFDAAFLYTTQEVQTQVLWGVYDTQTTSLSDIAMIVTQNSDWWDKGIRARVQNITAPYVRQLIGQLV